MLPMLSLSKSKRGHVTVSGILIRRLVMFKSSILEPGTPTVTSEEQSYRSVVKDLLQSPNYRQRTLYLKSKRVKFMHFLGHFLNSLAKEDKEKFKMLACAELVNTDESGEGAISQLFDSFEFIAQVARQMVGEHKGDDAPYTKDDLSEEAQAILDEFCTTDSDDVVGNEMVNQVSHLGDKLKLANEEIASLKDELEAQRRDTEFGRKIIANNLELLENITVSEGNLSVELKHSMEKIAFQQDCINKLREEVIMQKTKVAQQVEVINEREAKLKEAHEREMDRDSPILNQFRSAHRLQPAIQAASQPAPKLCGIFDASDPQKWGKLGLLMQ